MNNMENYITIDGKKIPLTDDAVEFLRGLNVQQTEEPINNTTSVGEIFEYYSMGDKHIGRRDPNMGDKVNAYKNRLINELNVRVNDIPVMMGKVESNDFKRQLNLKFDKPNRENLFD
jgi:hypothetical protein